MDRAEAIDLFVTMQPCYIRGGLVDEALNMAIAALREQEQLKRKLEKCQEENCRLVLKYAGGSRREKEQSEWISAKERLPALGKEVLICDISDERKYMDVWSLEDDEEGGVVWQGKNGEWYSLCEATHWMPLPEPPKENRPD